MLDRHSFQFETLNYPFTTIFYDVIRKCYRKIRDDFNKNGEPFYCPTTAACKFDAQNVTVVKTKTTYKETVASGPFVWVERDNVGFVTDNNGCL
uniref:Uncharacterized protein n=1 Tax=Panagrellus redivivus TaxID=6233 RepID=A0A7E4UR09_PANRE